MCSVTNAARSVNLPAFVAARITNNLKQEITIESELDVARGRMQIDLSDYTVGEGSTGLSERRTTGSGKPN